MDTLTLTLYIVEFILALGALAFVHELGHYLTSRLFGIEVEEFGFGLPPRIVKLFTFKGTAITLNAIPFGAFVRPKGENDPNVPGGLSSAPAWQRLVVFLGGPIFNLVTAVLLVGLMFSQVGSAPDLDTVQIVQVSPGSPAESAGLLADDIVIAFNGQSVAQTDQLRQWVLDNLDREVTLSIQRGEQTLEIRATPRSNPPEGQGALGIQMSNRLVKIDNYFQALPYATQMLYQQCRQIFLLPAQLLRGQAAPETARVVGPVGMFNIFQKARDMDQQAQAEQPAAGSINTLYLVASISLALGVFNLLPLPALDGGRIIFLLPEIIIRKRVRPEHENMVHAVGLMLLLLLMAYITVQDIFNPAIRP